MSTGMMARRIREKCQKDPKFRKKVIRLGALGDQMVYPEMDAWMQFAPQALEVAGEAGLLEGIDQEKLNILTDWISDSANELAYYVSPKQRMLTSPLYKKSVGYIFLSWSIKTPRDREAMSGVISALKWFNLKYFDYTEHQLDDKEDMTDQIIGQLEEHISKASISIETISSEVGRPWVRHERSLIDKNSNIHRFFACLEWEKAYLVSISAEQEARITRFDMSGGRLGGGRTDKMDQWVKGAADYSYFKSAEYIKKCYKLGSQIRSLLEQHAPKNPVRSFIDEITFRRFRDMVRFYKSVYFHQCINATAYQILCSQDCGTARLDDLFFEVPKQWQYSKVETGHWIFNPIGLGGGIGVRVRFFNVGKEKMSSAEMLMKEIEGKARERDWELITQETKRIASKIEGVDVVAKAADGITNRFVNFCYNGLEYFIEIKAETYEILFDTKSVWDAWIESFSLREAS